MNARERKNRGYMLVDSPEEALENLRRRQAAAPLSRDTEIDRIAKPLFDFREPLDGDLSSDDIWIIAAALYDAGLRSQPASEPSLDVERLGFRDLLTIGKALIEHYPPDTIVCSHSVKADIGAQTAAAIADLIDSCEAVLSQPADNEAAATPESR